MIQIKISITYIASFVYPRALNSPLGVQAKCPNYMQNTPFYSFLCVLCSIFRQFCLLFCCLSDDFYAFLQAQTHKHYQNITNFRKKSDICVISKPQYLQGPGSPISWYFLRELCRKGKITTLKFGNSWLINVDELYAFFKGGSERK